jgi:hypothetical protein
MIEIRVRKVVGRSGPGLVPVGPYDVEMLDGLDGTERRARLTKARSVPQNSLYWVTLANVLAGTHLGQRFASPVHLHRALLMATGRRTEITDLYGEIFFVPDSTAFDRMDGDDFRAYFDAAMAILAAEIGADPLQAPRPV